MSNLTDSHFSIGQRRNIDSDDIRCSGSGSIGGCFVGGGGGSGCYG
jgi:hypothetical protein